MDCLPGTYSEKQPKKYEPISVRLLTPRFGFMLMLSTERQSGQYIMSRLAATY